MTHWLSTGQQRDLRSDRGSGGIAPVEEDVGESKEDEGEVDDEDDGKKVSDGRCSLISTSVHVVTN